MKEIDRFQVISESGNEHTVIVYQEYIDVSTHDDPNASIPGSKSGVTLEGYHVNFIDENTFKIVETDEIVRRI